MWANPSKYIEQTVMLNVGNNLKDTSKVAMATVATRINVRTKGKLFSKTDIIM